MAEYELHSRKRIESFWSKEPSNNKIEKYHASSIDYFFDTRSPYHKSSETVGLTFLEHWRDNIRGRGSDGPVTSISFTESQLVEFIIEAEKALRSIRGK